MDAKMDSGYLGPGENYAQALEDDYDVTRELAPEEVIGVMDELLCHEVGGLILPGLADRTRWGGIWDIRSRKPSSPRSISTSYYGPSPKPLKTLILIGGPRLVGKESRRWSTWS